MDSFMKLDDIIKTLRTVYRTYDNIKLGIAGSYAKGTQHKDSDIDVVIDGDSMQVEIMDHIKSLFDIPVDVLWLELLREEDAGLDRLAIENGLTINEFSVYKTVLKEVIWI